MRDPAPGAVRRIALHVDGPTVRGNERQALLLIRGLQARGHRLFVSCRAGGVFAERATALGAAVTGTRVRGDVDVASALLFARWLRRARPDAVLLTSWKRAFVAARAARLARPPRIALRIGGPHTIPPRGVSRWKYRDALTRAVDVIIVNSADLRGELLAQLPELRRRAVVVVPNAVDPPLPTDDGRALRRELGLAGGDLLVCGVGGLEPPKRYDRLIEAFAAAAPRAAHLALAGDGPDMARLTGLARSLGVAERVHLLGHRADVGAVLAASDVFVHPSRLDSLPNAMLEAMSAGLPVIACEVPGVKDALCVRDGRPAAGWMVPRDDERGLTDALARVLGLARQGAPELAGAAAEARWRAVHWFGAAAMAERYSEVLFPSEHAGRG